MDQKLPCGLLADLRARPRPDGIVAPCGPARRRWPAHAPAQIRAALETQRVTIPGTATVALARIGGISLFREGGSPSFNVMGRALESLSPARTLTVKTGKDGSRLVIGSR